MGGAGAQGDSSMGAKAAVAREQFDELMAARKTLIRRMVPIVRSRSSVEDGDRWCNPASKGPTTMAVPAQARLCCAGDSAELAEPPNCATSSRPF